MAKEEEKNINWESEYDLMVNAKEMEFREQGDKEERKK